MTTESTTQTAMIREMLDAAQDQWHVLYGVRVVEEPVEDYQIGQYLAPSRVWQDNDPTDDLLDGTSAILAGTDGAPSEEEIRRAIDRTRPYWGQTILLIGGRTGEYGDDPSEIVIQDAVVLGAWSR